MNKDGAVHSSPGSSACREIFRNRRGFVKGCFAKPLPICFAFEAKSHAVIVAVDYAWKQKRNRLWIEIGNRLFLSIS